MSIAFKSSSLRLIFIDPHLGSVVQLMIVHESVDTSMNLYVLYSMNTLNSLQEIARTIRNLIRTNIVTDVDHGKGLC